MRNLLWLFSLCSVFLFISCEKKDQNSDVVSQSFIHKYGLNLSEQQWQAGEKDGQIITHRKNGVTIVNNYTGGALHGNTSYTYPDSEVIAQLLVYDQGTLTKKVSYDESAIPVQEEVYDLDNRKTITRWDLQGVPLNIEVYENDTLVKGEYFDKANECESSITNGTGERINRDRSHLLLAKDEFKDGALVHRITYHPSGLVQADTSYQNNVLHGKQMLFTDAGKPLMEATWDNGQLDGTKLLYTDGVKTTEIPYAKGKKNGIERHFDINQALIAEIHWINDLRHGSSRHYSDNDTKIDWFYQGKDVSLEKFQMMEFREKLVAETQGRPLDHPLETIK